MAQMPLGQMYTWPEIADRVIKNAQNLGIILPYIKFKRWLLEREPLGHSVDHIMKARCFKIWSRIRQNKDYFIVISGKERLGKSTLAIKICSWIQPDWNLDNLCVTFSEIMECIDRLKDKPYSAVLIDEGGWALFSRDVMTRVNKFLVKLFMVMGAKNLCMVVCVPNFHFMDTYIRDHRTDLLIQVGDKHSYKAIIGNGIRRVSKIGHKFKQISEIGLAKGTFWHGDWSKPFPPNVSEVAYLEKKNNFINKIIEDMRIEAHKIDNAIVKEAKKKKEESISTPEEEEPKNETNS